MPRSAALCATPVFQILAMACPASDVLVPSGNGGHRLGYGLDRSRHPPIDVRTTIRRAAGRR
ncbi:hypothetical protein PF005_g12540 [Phytophthora fragariae]|uniref:RxLR effector protein n=1 Tax=Phytophthora fragariae TaxID=53985 RepID=A0A6A3Y1L4_9STRA|nr:hypothetical protein PF005_g12540 [Phytophthora fragariae]